MSDAQSVHWFGSPWPSQDEPAPVCEDYQLQIEIPLGRRCERCRLVFEEGSQGVRLTALSAPWYVYWHAGCFLAEVVGESAAEIIWAEAHQDVRR